MCYICGLEQKKTFLKYMIDIDSDRKRELTSNIELYHVPSGQWSIKPTSGKPPLGVMGYSCSAVNNKI